MKNPATFPVLLQSFFLEHLVSHKGASPQTVTSYRDTFRLLLSYINDIKGIQPSNLTISNLDAPMILSFLDSIEKQRGNSIRTRNNRLAAIRSFFRFVALRSPEDISVTTRILAIPVKRMERKIVGYLTRNEIQAIINEPDCSKWLGRRNHAMFLTFYNCGARLSEITKLKRSQVIFGNSTFLHLNGKGRKKREIPIWKRTAGILKTWLNENSNDIVFPNARGNELSADGVSSILRQSVEGASLKCPSLIRKRITPHVIRHTTAMHLLQSGVDISVIALWLGDESIETTHIYVEANLITKEQALQKLSSADACFFLLMNDRQIYHNFT